MYVMNTLIYICNAKCTKHINATRAHAYMHSINSIMILTFLHQLLLFGLPSDNDVCSMSFHVDQSKNIPERKKSPYVYKGNLCTFNQIASSIRGPRTGSSDAWSGRIPRRRKNKQKTYSTYYTFVRTYYS